VFFIGCFYTNIYSVVFFMFILLPIRKVFGLTRGRKRSRGNINNSSTYRTSTSSNKGRASSVFSMNRRRRSSMKEDGCVAIGVDLADENGICHIISQTEFIEAIFPSCSSNSSCGEGKRLLLPELTLLL
jgi:hypothetical protein